MARTGGAGRLLDDALHLLTAAGCPVCAAAHDGVEAWLRSFVAEARTDLDAMDGVRGALGFCPVHTRRVLADRAASWVLPAVALELVDEGRERLAGGLAGRRPGAVAVCPACVAAARSAQSAAGLLAGALADPRVADALAAAGGLCAPHLVDLADDAAAGRGGAPAREAAAAVLAARLDDPATAADAVTGDDRDAPRRAALLPAVAALAAQDAAASAAGGGRARALAALQRATCPLCTAAAVAAWRYVAWVASSPAVPGRGEPPAPQDDVLCEVHLLDAAAVGGSGVERLVRAAATAARDRVTAALAASSGRRRADPAPGCRACAAARAAHERAWDLLDAVAADAVLADAARQAHGVCLRHGLRTAAGHGPAGRLTGEVLDGRLAVLAWELREGRRLERWDTRCEPVGAEAGAWRRATALLDGRVDLGTPAG